MHFNWLSRKKLSIRQGQKLLTEYCNENGFDDNSSQWKNPTHDTRLFAYHKRSNKIISNNWVANHLTRGNNKYSIWIDLVTEEIREVLR